MTLIKGKVYVLYDKFKRLPLVVNLELTPWPAALEVINHYYQDKNVSLFAYNNNCIDA